jgi:polysaccharide chain length determinant protein (PEP-CTERM system associated)
MEQGYRLIWQTLATAWRRRWLLVAAAWGVCLVGWAIVAAIPNSYESDAQLYVDTDAILTPMLKGITIDQDVEGQLAMMQKTLLSRPNLEQLIEATPLSLQVNNRTQRQEMVARLATTIQVDSEGPNLFTISYRNTNPQLAHDVVAALLNIFIDRATGTNRQDMANAQRFVKGQIAYYVTQLHAAEQRRAAFLRKYMDILPLQGGGLSHLDTARQTVTNLEWQLRDAQARLAILQQQQATTPPVLNEATIAGGGAGNSPQAQLAAAEGKLAELRTQYTSRFPDVIAAERMVDLLKHEVATAPQQKPTSPGFTIPNPVYEQLKWQIIEANSGISALRARLASAHQDLARMEALAHAAPEVEAQYQGLDRDYQVLRTNYDALLARFEASKITEAADTTADKVQLRVVDPPQVPTIPVAPKRFLLISLVLLAGLGTAVGLAVLLTQLDDSVGDLGQLRDLGQPVLGGISMAAAPRQRHLHLHPQAVGIALAVLVLVGVYGGLAVEIISNHKVLL